MTATKGTPDEARSARILLKDLVNAKLLHTVPPPGKEDDAAFTAGDGGAAGRKVPTNPTTSRWLGQMKAEYEAQEGSNANYASTMGARSKKGKQARGVPNGIAPGRGATAAQMQWRPQGANSVPDRLVAGGRRVEM